MILALTAMYGIPVNARPVNNRAASRPAARTAPRANTARPAASRPSASRPASRPNTARPNTARQSTVRPNTARQNTARQNTARPNTRNASYNRGNRLHGGRQIPADRFHAGFGRAHQFHIGHPIMIGGQASFQFGGFWFGIVDPWPAAWLYTDPVYVNFVDGGSVLVNVIRPDVQVAVAVGDPVNSCTASVTPVPLAQILSGPGLRAGDFFMMRS